MLPIDLREIELGRVPAADAVIRAVVPFVRIEVVGDGSVPLGEHEHVVAFLVAEPGDAPRTLGHVALLQIRLQHLRVECDTQKERERKGKIS